jgi:hypothetical protein
MKLYFLLIDSLWFHQTLTPTLGASIRKRSFRPCFDLCGSLLPAVETYANSFPLGQAASLIHQVSQGLPFDRSLWKALVGEMLLYGASEMPELPNIFATLKGILGSDTHLARSDFSPIEQVELGSRDIVIGGSCYRPEHAGLNDENDVKRLTNYLKSLDPSTWSPTDLETASELSSEEDREAELEFIRQELPNLLQIYGRACDRQQVIVCEKF